MRQISRFFCSYALNLTYRITSSAFQLITNFFIVSLVKELFPFLVPSVHYTILLSHLDEICLTKTLHFFICQQFWIKFSNFLSRGGMRGASVKLNCCEDTTCWFVGKSFNCVADR